MLKKQALIALAALGIGADVSGVAAQRVTYGSDTLFNVTKEALVAAGIATTDNTYVGGGSSVGGAAMNGGNAANPVVEAQHQQTSPQSRFLTNGECGAASGTAGAVGQSIEIGLDAIGIYRGNVGASTCTTLRHTNAGGDGAALPNGYNLVDWKDVLRVVYAGVYTKTDGSFDQPTSNPCTDATPARSAVQDITVPESSTALGRCNHPVRKALISQWSKLFQETNCTGKCTGALRHAWRRDDDSGTTDVFLTLLGLPNVRSSSGAEQRPFCNGIEYEDADPVRTKCDAGEQVCANIPYANRHAHQNNAQAFQAPAVNNPNADKIGDLGLVQAISIPTDTAKQYAGSDNACSLGKFAFVKLDSILNTTLQKCPDGNARQSNACRFPFFQVNATSPKIFGCRAVQGTRPGNIVFSNMDGRVYNAFHMDTAGVLAVKPKTGLSDPRWSFGGMFKIHQTTVGANSGGAPCHEVDATEQIGCLTQADECSIGYAGRAGLLWNGTTGNNNITVKLRSPADATVSSTADDDVAVKRLDLLQGGTAPACSSDFGKRYSLSRVLYLGSSKGFANVDDLGAKPTSPLKELTFAQWICTHKANVDTILNKYDYIPTDAFATFKCATATAAEPRTQTAGCPAF